MWNLCTETRRDGWIIDHDHLAEEFSEVSKSEGVTGPRDAPDAALEVLGEVCWPNHYRALPAGVRRFRIYDDDNILYYSGRQFLPDDATEDEEFGPLNDFGMPNDGATELRYFDETTHEWRTL